MLSQAAASPETAAESKPGYGRLMLLSLISAGAFSCILAFSAQDPQLTTADAEERARQALQGIGYTWARVRVENGVAHISGEAPGEPERVLAYEQVYKALRPLMTETKTITSVASHLTLTSEAVTVAEAPPPEADFKKPPERLSGWDAKIAPPDPPDTAPTPTPAATSEPPAAVAAEPTLDLAASSGASASSCRILERGAHEPPVLTYCPTPARNMEVARSVPTASPAPMREPDMVASVAAPEAALRDDRLGDTGATETAPQIETSSVDRQAAAVVAAPAEPAAAKTEAPAPDCKTDLAETFARASLHFASASAKLGKDSRPILDKLAAAAKACESTHITVLGYTDGYGSKTYNLALSRQRAEAVRDALVERGVARTCVSAKGLGAASPIASAETSGNRDRRIEFVLGEMTPAGTATGTTKSARNGKK